MQSQRYVAADWGTSNLRLYLLEQSGESFELVDNRNGPGVSQVNREFDDVFFDLVDGWIGDNQKMPIIISGMVGSSIGWKEAPYLACPVDGAKIAAGRVHFESRNRKINIVAGLSTVNPLGYPDVMRGEELQLLGWMHRHPEVRQETRLFVLPGTHNKWVLMRAGHIDTFLTALTGELFGLLRQHSVLITTDQWMDIDKASFLDGLATISELGDARMLHALFTTRSRQLFGDLEPNHAASYLSGLLVGSDVIGGYKLFKKQNPELEGATLIGDSRLAECYKLAFEYHDIPLRVCESTNTTLAGYSVVFDHLSQSPND
ncbi:MAG: 2-dehydro-3-deoxygalactonokinase [Pseudomonadota bacterium]